MDHYALGTGVITTYGPVWHGAVHLLIRPTKPPHPQSTTAQRSAQRCCHAAQRYTVFGVACMVALGPHKVRLHLLEYLAWSTWDSCAHMAAVVWLLCECWIATAWLLHDRVRSLPRLPPPVLFLVVELLRLLLPLLLLPRLKADDAAGAVAAAGAIELAVNVAPACRRWYCSSGSCCCGLTWWPCRSTYCAPATATSLSRPA